MTDFDASTRDIPSVASSTKIQTLATSRSMFDKQIRHAYWAHK